MQPSEALHTPLQILGVVLRNRIHAVLEETLHKRWFDDDGFLPVENLNKAHARVKEPDARGHAGSAVDLTRVAGLIPKDACPPVQVPFNS